MVGVGVIGITLVITADGVIDVPCCSGSAVVNDAIVVGVWIALGFTVGAGWLTDCAAAGVDDWIGARNPEDSISDSPDVRF